MSVFSNQNEVPGETGPGLAQVRVGMAFMPSGEVPALGSWPTGRKDMASQWERGRSDLRIDRRKEGWGHITTACYLRAGQQVGRQCWAMPDGGLGVSQEPWL